jgi:hypothetical protein
MSRYLIADPALGMGWGHIFTEKGGERERMTRFVYDREGNPHSCRCRSAEHGAGDRYRDR